MQEAVGQKPPDLLVGRSGGAVEDPDGFVEEGRVEHGSQKRQLPSQQSVLVLEGVEVACSGDLETPKGPKGLFGVGLGTLVS